MHSSSRVVEFGFWILDFDLFYIVVLRGMFLHACFLLSLIFVLCCSIRMLSFVDEMMSISDFTPLHPRASAMLRPALH